MNDGVGDGVGCGIGESIGDGGSDGVGGAVSVTAPVTAICRRRWHRRLRVVGTAGAEIATVSLEALIKTSATSLMTALVTVLARTSVGALRAASEATRSALASRRYSMVAPRVNLCRPARRQGLPAPKRERVRAALSTPPCWDCALCLDTGGQTFFESVDVGARQ